MPSRRELFDVLCEKAGETRAAQKTHVVNYLVNHYGKAGNAQSYVRMSNAALDFCNNVFSKLDKCRTRDRLRQKYGKWLDSNFDIDEEESPEDHDQTVPSVEPSTSSRCGRPKVTFEEGSSRTKRRRAVQLSTEFEVEELTKAAIEALKAKGKDSEATIITEAVFTTPTRAAKIRKAWRAAQKSKEIIPLTPDEAVSLIDAARLTKHQYEVIRQYAKERHVDIYPSYRKVLEARARRYPPIDARTVAEQSDEDQE